MATPVPVATCGGADREWVVLVRRCLQQLGRATLGFLELFESRRNHATNRTTYFESANRDAGNGGHAAPIDVAARTDRGEYRRLNGARC